MSFSILRPGSAAWFVRHELRLHWRRSKLGRWRWMVATLIVGAAMLYHVPALAMARFLSRFALPRPELTAGISLLLGFAFALMLSQALKASVESLYERGDIDWLRASPIPLRRVLMARLLGIAASVVWPWMLFGGPAANAMAAYGHPEMLALYPVLFCAALFATSLGAAATIGLAASVGLRMTRAISTALAMVTASGAFLASQAQLLLSPRAQAAMWRAMLTGPADIAAGKLGGLVWWPARAVLGDAMPLAAVMALGIGGAMATSFFLERRFEAGAMEDGATAKGGAPRTRGRRSRDTAPRFSENLRWILVRKELRLMARAPGMVGQTIYKLVYLLPLALVVFRGAHDVAAAGLATLPVFFVGELARLFMTTAISADTASELARTAPVAPAMVRNAKILAACLAIVALGAAPVLAIASLVPRLIPAMLAGTACVAASEILLGLWKSPPGRRQDLGGGHEGFNLADWIGTLVSMAWSGATWLALNLNPMAAVPVAIALALLAIARPRRERAVGVLAAE